MRTPALLLLLSGCQSIGCWDVEGNHTAGECACPSGGDLSDDAVAAVNAARADAGVSPVARVAELDAAAQAHVEYLVVNDPDALGRSSHTEVQGETGFTGAEPIDRAVAAGWRGTRLYEDISRSGDPERAVFSWLRTVYHRMPLLVPEVDGMGYASVCNDDVRFDVALLSESGTVDAVGPVVWPAAGDDFVSGTWSGLERPDPLPDIDADVGYPISVQFARGTGRITGLELFDPAGEPVQTRFLSPETDPAQALDDEFAAVPLEPLAFDAEYTVRAQGVDASGEFVHEWSFTTRTKDETPR